MTDGRIPGMWISQPRFIELDADTWCVLSKAITWSNEAGTDGHVPSRYLPMLHPDGHRPEAYAKLCEMGIWYRAGDGYQFSKWADKPSVGGLGQSTAEQVEANKAKNRDRQRKHRANRQTDPNGPGGRDVTRDITRDVGQGQGQGRGIGDSGNEELKNVDTTTGEILEGGDQNAEATPDSRGLNEFDAEFLSA